MLLHRRDADAFADATASPTMSDQVAAELAAFGVTHADEGAAALDAWGFPDAVRRSGRAAPARRRGTASTRSGGCLRVAEAVALEHAPMPGYPTPPDVDRLLLAIRLRPDDFDVDRRAKSTASSNASPTCSESKP